MTTFTKLAAGEKASIAVYPSHKLSKVNDNIYAGFTEHMGRCIYGGLYDPDNPNKELIDDNGFRKDVIESFQELNVPVVRYPGGNFCATYHWMDGVGTRESRPKRPELAWVGIESNQFGTDEFMKWCEIVGTEPYLALNMGTGTLDEGEQIRPSQRGQNTDQMQRWRGLSTATPRGTHITPTCVARTVVKSRTMSSIGLSETRLGDRGK